MTYKAPPAAGYDGEDWPAKRMTNPTPAEIMTRIIQPELDDRAAGIIWGGLAFRQIEALTAAGYGIADLSTHVIVPREPTQAMLDAGTKAWMTADEDDSIDQMWAAILKTTKDET